MNERTRQVVRIALPLLLYLVVALVIALGVTRAPGSRLPGDSSSDAGGVERGLWVARAESKTPFTLTRDDYEGAPEGVPQAPAINLVEPVQPAAVWSLSTIVGRVAALNVLLLLGLLTTAAATYFLATSLLQVGPLAATTAGFTTAFNPWVIEQSLAGHLAFTMLWPLIALIAALAYVDVRRSVRAAVVVGLAYGASFLTAAYVGLLATALVLAGLIVLLRRSEDLAERLYVATLASVALVVTVAVLVPGLVAYALHRSETARIAGHTAAGGEATGVWPQQYLNPAPMLRLLGSLHVGSRSLAFGAAESVVFFGYITLALAVAAVWLWRRGAFRSRGVVTGATIVLCVVAAVVAFVLSLPPHLALGGVHVPLPSDVLAAATTYYRVYSRFAVVVAICAALLASLVVDYAWRRRPLVGAAFALGIVLELWPSALPTWSTAARPLDRWLATHPRGIVAVYPQPTDSEIANRLALTNLAQQPNNADPSYTLVSGGTGGTREAAIRILTRYLTDPATPGLLAAEHVRYVVVDDTAYAAEGTQPATPPASAFRFAGAVPGSKIYELRKSVVASDIGTVLEQNAVEIALVQGLAAPTLTYSGFALPGSDGWRTFKDGASIQLSSSGGALKRVQLVVHVRALGSASAQIALLDTTGAVDSSTAAPPQDTQVTLGPLPVSSSRTTFTFRVAPATAAVQLGAVLVQPLADFSVSLAKS